MTLPAGLWAVASELPTLQKLSCGASARSKCRVRLLLLIALDKCEGSVEDKVIRSGCGDLLAPSLVNPLAPDIRQTVRAYGQILLTPTAFPPNQPLGGALGFTWPE